MIHQSWLRFKALLRRRQMDRDLQDEIQFHLAMREQSSSETGARWRFGNVALLKESCRDLWTFEWLETLMQDVRYAARILRKSPGFTTAAVLTLALGIGANTAIFSLLNAILLRNLPVRDPQQLVLFGKGEWVGSQDTLPDRSWQLFSYPFYREFRRENRVFSDVAAINSILFGSHGRITGRASLEKIDVELVSGSYFNMLGINPIAGRVFTDSDDQTPGAHPVAVASDSWWQRRFARDPGVVGTTVTIGSTIYTIIGISPPDFFGVTVGQRPDLWIPLAMEKEISPGWNGLTQNLFQSLYIVARRKPGVSVERASANTNLLFKQILQGYAGQQPSRKQLQAIQNAKIDLTNADKGLSQLRLRFSESLKLLMAVVALVLLIACANIANLLLARGASRRGEIAVRMAIGAGRSRLIRQLLVESGLLGLAGVLLGVLCSWNAGQLLVVMASPQSGAIPIRVAPDVQVLCFTVAVAIFTVLLFGLAPAFRGTRLELAPALKQGRGADAATRNRFSRNLVVGQISLSLMLLVGAGLFLRSLKNLTSVDTGFDRKNVLIVGVDPSASSYRLDARLENVMEQIEGRVGALPGVHGASFAFSVFGGGWTDPATVPGRPTSDNDPDVFQNIVGAQYFDVMKIPIVLGRGLNVRDNSASRRVAVITEEMARIYFPDGSPIGRTFSIGAASEWQDVEIVGVAKDVKYMSLRQRQMPAAFYPHSQHPMFLYNLVTRYTGDPKSAVAEIRKAVHSIDANLPVSDAMTLDHAVEDSTVSQRLVAQLSTAFGLLAAFLSCVGIYGVVSYGVARRTNEFGIRMALGAEHCSVIWLVLREVLLLLIIGVSIGMTAVLALGRVIHSMLFGLTPADPISAFAATTVLLVVGMAAGYLPARRAARIDPMGALRSE